MINDRLITISVAGNRKSTKWLPQTLLWSELVDRLKTPVRGLETLDEYLKSTQSKQVDLKDVGGFVGGALIGERRKANSVSGRDVVTLDLDDIAARGTSDVLQRVAGLGCGYALYSTRKHHEAGPRLRVLFPLSRTATADEYEPIARKLAETVGISMADPTCFRVYQLMYWPSCSSDGQYVYTYEDKPFIDSDGVLGMYANWRDVQSWPHKLGEGPTPADLAAKQADPETKRGTVGAFCRVYDVYSAMEKFLPNIYEPCDTEERFTYAGGSTVAGAVIQEHGKFLYSFHATDPCSGSLVNAFDLVRLHLYGKQDAEVAEGCPTNRLPSYTAMCTLAIADEAVAQLMQQERYAGAVSNFSKVAVIRDDNRAAQSSQCDTAANASWMKELSVSPTTGQPAKTTRNVLIMLDGDPQLKGKILKDIFADRIMGLAPLPWALRKNQQTPFEWTDNDSAGLRDYTERILGYRSKDIIEDGIILTADASQYDPVCGFLDAQEWDGVPRLDTYFIDYLGAKDTLYTRTVTRKAFVAAVARAKEPGTKFDNMVVLSGPQGIGKSTSIKKMAGKWFSDSLESFEGKDAADLIQGIWIIEISELEAFRRAADMRQVKQFLSRLDDRYRSAYARHTKTHERRCIFFGTTNDKNFLHDQTGNRRFWPVVCGATPPNKSVFGLAQDTIAQLWAEAVARWQIGEPLYLNSEIREMAEEEQRVHTVEDDLKAAILDFLERPIPIDWMNWEMFKRKSFLEGQMPVGVQLTLARRDRVCTREIWRECMKESKEIPTKIESARINSILNNLDGWEPTQAIFMGEPYGKQRGFKSVATPQQSKATI